MKNIVTVQIKAPIKKVAQLISDPQNNKLWMVNIKSYKQLQGKPGEVGSKHELVLTSERGDIVFTATIKKREPTDFEVLMQSKMLQIVANARLKELAPNLTEYSFEQDFQFNGVMNKIFGALASKSIKEQQAKDVESFKVFVEKTK